MPIFSPYEQTTLNQGYMRARIETLEQETGGNVRDTLLALKKENLLTSNSIEAATSLQYTFLDTPATVGPVLELNKLVPNIFPTWLITLLSDDEDFVKHTLGEKPKRPSLEGLLDDFGAAANRHLPHGDELTCIIAEGFNLGSLFNPNSRMDDKLSLEAVTRFSAFPLNETACLNEELVLFFANDDKTFNRMMHFNPHMSKELLLAALVRYGSYEPAKQTDTYLNAVLRTVPALESSTEQAALARHAFDIMKKADNPALTENVTKFITEKNLTPTLLTALAETEEALTEDIEELSLHYIHTLLPSLFTENEAIRPSRTIFDAVEWVPYT